MKKSELRKLIREIIKEQSPGGPGGGEANFLNYDYTLGQPSPDILVAQASSIIVNNTSGFNALPNGGYSIRCPQGYTFEGFEEDTTPGNIDVDAANTPPSGFFAIGDYPMFVISRCIKKVGTSLVSTGQPQRYSCDAVQGCVPSSTGPFASLEECQASACEEERPDKGTQTLDPVTPYVGPTGRPYSGGPLQENTNKNIRKKLNKK
jgi:hypothetical protein